MVRAAWNEACGAWGRPEAKVIEQVERSWLSESNGLTAPRKSGGTTASVGLSRIRKGKGVVHARAR
jgi:hypothetical protein